MTRPRNYLTNSPVLVRAFPFLAFVGLTALQGQMGEASQFWVYLAKTIVGAWLVWEIRPLVPEMRWAFTWDAVIVGIVVFAIWVGANGLYPQLNEAGPPWNPLAQFGERSITAWFFVVVRIAGSALVVPPLEEVFYRSLLYRSLVNPEFLSVPFRTFSWMAFLITALVFGSSHVEWLAGILCAFAYQGLVIRKNRLGDAMTAHAITNAILAAWIVWKGAWQFW